MLPTCTEIFAVLLKFPIFFSCWKDVNNWNQIHLFIYVNGYANT